jgi:hypothetical protein
MEVGSVAGTVLGFVALMCAIPFTFYMSVWFTQMIFRRETYQKIADMPRRCGNEVNLPYLHSIPLAGCILARAD